MTCRISRRNITPGESRSCSATANAASAPMRSARMIRCARSTRSQHGIGAGKSFFPGRATSDAGADADARRTPCITALHRARRCRISIERSRCSGTRATGCPPTSTATAARRRDLKAVSATPSAPRRPADRAPATLLRPSAALQRGGGVGSNPYHFTLWTAPSRKDSASRNSRGGLNSAGGMGRWHA